MAYQNVGTPRFFIDMMSYLKNLGMVEDVRASKNSADLIGNPFDLDPTRASFINSDTGVLNYGCDVEYRLNRKIMN